MKKNINEVVKLYNKFYLENYANIDKKKSTIQKHLNKTDFSKTDSFNRRMIFIPTLYYFNIDTVNTITSTFKLTKIDINRDETEDIIFGFGYYNIKSESTTVHQSKNERMFGNLVPKFIVINGSYESKDGEFRNGIISLITLDIIQSYVLEKYHLNDLLIEIINYCKKTMNDRKYGLYEDFFYPSEDVKIKSNYKDTYENINMLYVYFAFAWFKFFYDLYLDIIPNHLNTNYKDFFTKNSKWKNEDLKFFTKLLNKYNNKTFLIFKYILNNYINRYITNENELDDVLLTNRKYGQKIIPLSISEVENPFNIAKKPWREYLISLHLTDFVLNNIAPNFAITNTWMYIKNSKKGLFDNDIQYDKMDRSEIAEQIHILLKRAYTYSKDNENNKYKNNKLVKSIVINKFKTLTEKINEPILYINDEILMSNVALNIISEYVGRTFYDVVFLSKSKYYNDLIGNPFTGNGINFSKYMFDLCYALLCLNKRGGVIHGDLHLNNITIRSAKYKNKPKNSKTFYIIGDNLYCLPDTNYHMCLIDFSRSIISNDFIDQYNDLSLPKSFIIKKSPYFFNDQIERMIHIYKNYNSSINHEELKYMFTNNHQFVFKLLTVLDLYGFCKKSIQLLNSDIIKPDKSCITLLTKLKNDCNIYLNDHIVKLMNGDDSAKDMEFPLLTIIKNNFDLFLFDKNNKIDFNINDIYNIDNELKYSSNLLEKFHPSMFMRASSHKEELNNCINTRKKYEELKKKNMNMVNYIANRQSSKVL